MQIKSTIRIAKVKSENIQELKTLSEGDHEIAWPQDIDKQISFTEKVKSLNNPIPKMTQLKSFNSSHSTISPLAMTTLSLKSMQDKEQSKILQKHYLELGKQGLKILNQAFPNTFDKPLDGMELIIATSKAYKTWTTPENTYIESSLKSGEVLLKAFDVFEPYFPVLQKYGDHMKVAGLLLNVANEVYMLNKEYKSAQSAHFT